MSKYDAIIRLQKFLGIEPTEEQKLDYVARQMIMKRKSMVADMDIDIDELIPPEDGQIMVSNNGVVLLNVRTFKAIVPEEIRKTIPIEELK